MAKIVSLDAALEDMAERHLREDSDDEHHAWQTMMVASADPDETVRRRPRTARREMRRAIAQRWD